MAVFKPFHGLLPKPEQVAAVAAVPYDVVNSTEAAALAEGNPLSFLRVSRPEIEMEPGVDLYSEAVYEKAAANFNRLREAAPLELDAGRHLYVYSLNMNGHVQTGVVGAASAVDYDNDIIKKHEKTRRDKEDDRARHVMTLRSQTGPVFLTYRANEGVDEIVAAAVKRAPLFDFAAADGVSHTLWRLDPETSEKLSGCFAGVEHLYIADGHHRAASASRAAKTCRGSNPNHTGDEEYNYFLAVAFPGDQLKILSYNRVVKDLNGWSKDAFLAEVGERYTVTPTSNPTPAALDETNMYLDGQWYALKPKFDTSSLGVIDSLDVSVLQNNVLGPILGIDDPRTSKRIDFVGGIRGTGELEKRVDGGEMAVAFAMNPTTVEQLMAIADADEIMPPKSTWFEPKLRDGLVCHNF